MSATGRTRYLADAEILVMEVRRHPAVLIGPVGAAVVVAAAAAAAGFVTSPARGSDPVDVVAGVVAAAFALRAAWRWWEWRVDRIVVTDRRIFEVSGLVTRRVASMPLGKVTDMTYRRSLLGRILGYGDLLVESAGQRQALDRIDFLPKPDHFYRTVTSLVTGDPSPPPPDEDDTGPLPRVVV